MRRFLIVTLAVFISISSFADTKYFITNPIFHVDNPTTGDPLSGGLIYFYEPGTTTLKDTWSDASGETEYLNTNPVVLNSYGNAVIYGATSYKVIIKTSGGTTLATMDNVQFSQTVTTFASEILAAADAATVRTALELGTAALVDSGTGANNALVLDSTGALPAIDGSKLTGFTDDQIRLFPQGYISGFTMSNYVSGNVYSEIQIATGACRDSGDTEDIVLSSVFIKSVSDTFAEGSGNGGNMSGYAAGSYTWHVFAIKAVSPETEREDVGFSSSLTPTLPSGFSKYRRIGSVITDATGHIIRFHQFGDTFYWDEPQVDIDPAGSTNASTTVSTYTLTKVPNGVSVEAIVNAFAQKSTTYVDFALYPTTMSVDAIISPVLATARSFIQNPDQSSISLGYSIAYQGEISDSLVRVMTNTSAQIKGMTNTDDCYLAGIVLGWVDSRGKD